MMRILEVLGILLLFIIAGVALYYIISTLMAAIVGIVFLFLVLVLQ